jgi:hypothetical protein
VVRNSAGVALAPLRLADAPAATRSSENGFTTAFASS